MALRTRAVLVHRRTELDELLDRHATRGQAEFFLRTRGRGLAEVEARHDAAASARRAVAASVPSDWALAEVERADLEGMLGSDDELVVTVQSDRLVVFGDGMEADRLEVSWGQEVRVGMAERRLRLV